MEIRITMSPDGRMQMVYPHERSWLVLRALEEARSAVIAQGMQREQNAGPAIAVANALPPFRARGV